MVDIPYSRQTVRDPGLGVANAASLTPVVVGVSASGTANEFKLYNDSGKLLDAHGYGDGVEAALQILELAGGPVGFVRVSPSVAAASGAVTKVGTSPDITITGDTPAFDAFVRVEITLAGDLGVGKFRFCLDGYSGDADGERTWSPDFAIPAGGVYSIPGLGVEITFAAGAYVVGDQYTWLSDGPGFNATDLGPATDAAFAALQDWRYLVIVTSRGCGNATAHAALASALQTDLQAAVTSNRFRAAMIPGSVDDTEDPTTAFGTLVADRELISFGTERRVARNRMIGRANYQAPASVVCAVRAAGSLISTDLKRVPGNGINDGGPLPGTVKLFTDERLDSTGYGDFKMTLLRSYQGRSGFYITQGYIKSADGSDITIWPRRLIMDIACEVTHNITETFIGRGLRTNADGTIDERDALRLEDEVESGLRAALIEPRNAEGTDGHVSAVRYSINRLNNFLSTGVVQGTVGVRPLGYIDYIENDLGYVADLGTEGEV